MSTHVGIDLGGTKIAAGLFDAATNELLAEKIIATNAERGFDAVFKDIVALVESLRDDTTTGVGIGVPGLVYQPEGRVLKLPNIAGAEHVPLKEKLHEALRIPVEVENDANCFALAEAVLGAGQGKSVVIGITLGTGVGGGIVIHGQVFRGSRGLAGEIGHMLLRPEQPPYATNDRRGDIEQFLSGNAIHKRIGSGQQLDSGVADDLHVQLVMELSWACASLTHLLDPDVIVIGGGAGRALTDLLPAVQDELQRWVIAGTPLPQVVPAQLETAEVLGAAMLLKDNRNQ